MLETITAQAKAAAEQLLAAAQLSTGDIVVVGCSTSEVGGHAIGTDSVLEVAEAVFDGLYPVLQRAGVSLAAQCCEHLNRAIVLERAALKPWQQPVNVVPQPHAGGSFATTAWQNMRAPVALEQIEADAGLDIGDTLIGMHLKRVAVPVRLSARRLGQANLVAARTRPKFIGGARAAYLPEEELR